MKRFLFFFAICALLALALTKQGLTQSGIISTGELEGFAVDSYENIYIGKLGIITVYQNGKAVDSFSPPTSRAYRFYVENDMLIIGCAFDGLGGLFDLSGNCISYGVISYEEVRRNASNKTTYVVNDNAYSLHTYCGLLPYTIYCNEERAFSMSPIDYFFNGPPFWILMIALLWCVGVVVIDIVRNGTVDGTKPLKKSAK